MVVNISRTFVNAVLVPSHGKAAPALLVSNISIDILYLRNTMYYKKEVGKMTISIRLNAEDTALIKNYAKLNNISISDFIRQAALEHIEDEYDLMAYEKAMAEYKANPVTYSHKEVGKILGLD